MMKASKFTKSSDFTIFQTRRKSRNTGLKYEKYPPAVNKNMIILYPSIQADILVFLLFIA